MTPTYHAVHKRINRAFPRVGRCEFCATTDRPTEYAEVRPGRLSQWRHDWFELCRRCHRAFDGQPTLPNLAKATAVRATQQMSKTHCIRGHSYDTDNTGITKGGKRYCRTCARLRMRASRGS